MSKIARDMAKVKSDTILKDFWRINERFADLFNTCCFGGEQIIDPTQLVEADTDISGVIDILGDMQSIARNRDVVKKHYHGTDFILLGIESQMEVHYSMPLRVMIMDALNYLKQIRALTDYNKQHGINLDTPAEFLSGIKATDKLHPVITLVIYYGKTPWDGPLKLSDMFIDMPEDLQKFVSDYNMNLMQLIDAESYQFSHPDCTQAFNITKLLMTEQVSEVYEKYGHHIMKSDVLRFIGKVSNKVKFISLATQKGNKKEVTMGEALDKWERTFIQQGEATGQERGIEIGKEQGIEIGEKRGIVKTLFTKLHMSAEQIAADTELPIEEVNEILAQVNYSHL